MELSRAISYFCCLFIECASLSSMMCASEVSQLRVQELRNLGSEYWFFRYNSAQILYRAQILRPWYQELKQFSLLVEKNNDIRFLASPKNVVLVIERLVFTRQNYYLFG